MMVTAGCMGPLAGDDGEDGLEPDEYAPDGAELLVHFDGEIAHDEETQDLVEGLIEMDPHADEDELDDLEEEFEDETGLDITEFEEALAFGTLGDAPGEDEFGAIVASTWDEDDVVAAVEDEEGTDYEVTEHAGEDVLYEPVEEPEWGDALYVGVIDDGEYVLGDEGAVHDALDVAHDDADTVSGPVLDVYESAADGHVTAALEVPEDEIPDDGQPGQPDEIDFEALNEVEAVSAVYYTDDGNAGLEVQALVGSTEDAEDIKDTIDAAITLFEQMEDDDDLVDELDNITIEHEDRNVYVTYENDVDDILDALEEWEEQQQTSDPYDPAPMASYEWETDGDDVTLTHTSGDHIHGDEVYVMDDFGDVVADEDDFGDEFTAGDTVTIEDGATADGLMLVYDDGQHMQVLTEYQP